MGTHPIFESDFDCLTEGQIDKRKNKSLEIKRLMPLAYTLKPITEKIYLNNQEISKIKRSYGAYGNRRYTIH